MSFCVSCGNPLKPGARFCGNCGASNTGTGENTTHPETFGRDNRFTAMEFTMKNSQRRIVNLWLFLTAVFIFLIFLPSIIGLDGFDGGFALSFASGFMAIMSIIIVLIYRSRARQLDSILAGEGRIAVWKYSPDEWERFTAIDFEEEKKTKKALFFLVSGICVVVGIIMLLVVKDILILYISLAIIPVVAIPAYLAPRMRYNKLKESEGKALIAEKGVIVGRMFHLWVKLGASLDQVVLVTDEVPPILEFHYSMPTRNGRQQEVARVPVPSGKMDEAERIGEYFGKNIANGD